MEHGGLLVAAVKSDPQYGAHVGWSEGQIPGGDAQRGRNKVGLKGYRELQVRQETNIRRPPRLLLLRFSSDSDSEQVLQQALSLSALPVCFPVYEMRPNSLAVSQWVATAHTGEHLLHFTPPCRCYYHLPLPRPQARTPLALYPPSIEAPFPAKVVLLQSHVCHQVLRERSLPSPLVQQSSRW